jgi:hypothetical protein
MILVRKYGPIYTIKPIPPKNGKITKFKEINLPEDILISILKLNVLGIATEDPNTGKKTEKNTWLLY